MDYTKLITLLVWPTGLFFLLATGVIFKVSLKMRNFCIVMIVIGVLGITSMVSTLGFSFIDRVDNIVNINELGAIRGIFCFGGKNEAGENVWNYGYYREGKEMVSLDVFRPQMAPKKEASRVVYKRYYTKTSWKLFFLFPMSSIEVNDHFMPFNDVRVLITKDWAQEMRDKWQISFSWY